MTVRTWFVIAGLFLLPAAGAAQSLFSTAGLGVPVAPVDARARVLGGTGVGLLAGGPSFVNPAEATAIPGRGALMALQPTYRTIDYRGAEADAAGTRFPVLQALFPLGDSWGISIGLGSFLDQSWSIATDGTETIGAETVQTRDVITSSGGVGQVRLGIGYAVNDALSLGLAVGRYTGEHSVRIRRTFPDTALSVPLQPFATRTSWDYGGTLAVLGARWDPVDGVRLGGAVTWSSGLSATGDEGVVEGRERSFGVPLQFAGGASALLSPRLLAAVSGRWAGWGGAASLEDTAVDSWEVGGGLEWRGVDNVERAFPIRIGTYYARLPFELQGAAVTEWTVAAGAGVELGLGEAGPVAAVNSALEWGLRGDAGAAGLEEQIWRATVSVTLFGR